MESNSDLRIRPNTPGPEHNSTSITTPYISPRAVEWEGDTEFLLIISGHSCINDAELGISWSDADDKKLEARVDKLQYLQKFWKMVWCQFPGCTSPYAIFTYGVRLGQDQDEILKDLYELLPHPA
ncbi:hypothetical protein F4804DRAFT_353410 [Jackrogersella minutella]|nr:hypothetical protein F4804DRAFT_353410 [Jackrogersella minutella]